jgi:hypothetical protein
MSYELRVKSYEVGAGFARPVARRATALIEL